MSAPQQVTVITIATENRRERVERQRASLAGGAGVEHLCVPLPEGGRLPLAAARNAGAQDAISRGAELLVFLDADCLASSELIERYVEASTAHPDALLAGPVTYLTETETTGDVAAMQRFVHPHTARPNPPAGECEVWPAAAGRRGRYNLFWSLSFALTPTTWQRIGGFDEAYAGYGGEDTDFAYRAHARAVPLVWVGGAHAMHQWHPVSSPPIEHLDDILINGRIFADRWGSWPMTGWLRAFEALGLVTQTADGNWLRTDVGPEPLQGSDS